MKKGLVAILFILLLTGSAFANKKDLLSLNFVDAPVHYILTALGNGTGLNFAISKEAGAKTVSVAFNDVPVTEALDMIAEAADIIIRQSKPNFYVVGNKVADPESEKAKAAAEQAQAFRDEVVKSFSVKYVSTEDVEKALAALYGKNDSFRIARLAQGTGREHAQVVVATADSDSMEKVSQLIAKLDVPKPMIEIEVNFIETISNNDKNQGLEWSILPEGLAFGENPEFAAYKGIGEIYRFTPLSMTAFLQAVQVQGSGRVLANPRIRVIAGQEANFSSETQVPILSKNKDGEVQTEWKNVGISLNILPSKMDDGTIRLQVSPRVSSIIGEKKLGDVVAPVISERKSDTTVFLKHGEMFIIGGLMSDREIKTLSKVPVLHQIPLFGELFKSTRTTKEKSNIIVVLRPREIVQNTALDVKPAPVVATEQTPCALEQLRAEIKQTPAQPMIQPATHEQPTPAPVDLAKLDAERDYEARFEALVSQVMNKEVHSTASGISTDIPEPAKQETDAPVDATAVLPWF